MPVTVTTGDADEVLLGAGVLYVAPIGTTEPTTAAQVTAASAWREVGWTQDGSAIDLAYQNVAVNVEEEFYPPKYVTVSVEASVSFNMAQATRKNLALAMNLGAAYANNDTSIEPPSPGSEVRVMGALITEEGALWVFRRMFQGGPVKIERKKAPNVATIPVSFRLEKPSSAQPFIVYPTAAGLI